MAEVDFDVVCLGLLIIRSYNVEVMSYPTASTNRTESSNQTNRTESSNQIALFVFFLTRLLRLKFVFLFCLIVFQRFEHSKKSKKISTYIPFPQQLDMAPFMASRYAKLSFITQNCSEETYFSF